MDFQCLMVHFGIETLLFGQCEQINRRKWVWRKVYGRCLMPEENFLAGIMVQWVFLLFRQFHQYCGVV